MKKTEPYEAATLPDLPMTVSMREEFSKLIIGIQGGLWHSSSVEAAVLVIKYLRANPDSAQVLLETQDI